ncbi:sucrose-phosphate phosphatase [Pleurocapsa sp. CCALA 161]|uniref:sucrose-phosphate phosphatase n=1 Tax=Pleurocapsa sp. CCALA 161 TaxID=2107688 RepID=UPI000D05FF79|nr:sucrose-phosphate phosphatase [Pleurocapsa sp. CCALA 161]PSB09273.1 sucrose-phosphate phosphatase [Pleurocapsa sp. CCALA 161]
MSPFLFVTDLDNTLVGDDAALLELNQKLAAHRQQYHSKIVYATGRSLYLYRLLAEAKSLLPPDALITAVGTEMYFDQQESQYDREWANILAQGWNRQEIAAIASQFTDLQLQPNSEQNPFKISYYLAEAVAESTLAELQAALKQKGFEIKLIYSAGQDLDLLPKNGDKGLAVQFLRRRWKIAPEQTIVCGDSGNDISMFEGQEKSLLVANAKPELLEWYAANQTEYNYLAKADCAGGIIEGLKHFGFI